MATTATKPHTETRSAEVDFTNVTTGGTVTGYAAVFGSLSLDLGFREVLRPGCFRDALASGDDILLLWGHDRNQPLARVSAGSLELREDTRGLRFQAKVSDTQAGRDALVLIRDRVVKGCSFGFVIAEDTWSTTPEGEPLRYVDRVGRLLEITLTADPAYTATSVEARAALGRLKRENTPVPTTTAPRTVQDVRRHARKVSDTRRPYRQGGPHSYFRDLYVVAHHDGMRRLVALEQERREPGPNSHDERRGGYAGPLGSGLDSRLWADSPAGGAADRLAVHRRDVTTADPGAAGFTPTGLPSYVAEAVAVAVRARSVASRIFPVQPLPTFGLTVQTGRITTGATVGVQATQLAAVSEGDIDTDLVGSPVATIAGHVDISAQAFDRGAPGAELDGILARELGAAYAAELDRQAFNGTGASGQLLGLLNLPGTNSTPYADATPTVQELWPVLMANRSAVSTALGYSPSTIILHARRYSWMLSQRDTAGGRFNLDVPGAVWIEANALPVTLGAGAEDAILFVEPSELPMQIDTPQLEVFPEILSSTLTVRVRLRNYCAMLSTRRPEAVGKITGSGLTVPTFA